MGKLTSWRFRDPRHIDAHRRDFLADPGEILDELLPLLASRFRDMDDDAWIREDFPLSYNVGYSGLKSVPGDGSGSFWGYRMGRSIPSHLVIGQKEATANVSIWGYREETTLVVHTIYPGWSAPREIHDTEISLEELSRAVPFWSRYAIVVSEGEYSHEPYL